MYGKLKNLGIALILPIGMYLFFAVLTLAMGNHLFCSMNGLRSIVLNGIVGSCIAYGIAVNFMGGRLDFSAGAIILLASIIGYQITYMVGGSAWMMLLICVVAGCVLSTIIGAIYVALRMPLVIISLGMVIIYEALSCMLFEGKGAKAFSQANLSILGGMPQIFIVFAIVLVIFWVYTRYTVTSYQSRALARHQVNAVNIGIRENRNVVITYIVAGILLGLASAVYVSRNLVEAASGLSSTGIMFNNFVPVQIGLYLAMYAGETIGICSAATAIAILNYGLACLGYDSPVQLIFIGIFLVAFSGYTNNKDTLKGLLWRKRTIRQ